MIAYMQSSWQKYTNMISSSSQFSLNILFLYLIFITFNELYKNEGYEHRGYKTNKFFHQFFCLFSLYSFRFKVELSVICIFWGSENERNCSDLHFKFLSNFWPKELYWWSTECVWPAFETLLNLTTYWMDKARSFQSVWLL